MSLFLALIVAAATPPAQPEPFPYPPELEAMGNDGYNHFVAGDFAAAESTLTKVTQLAPDNPRAWRLLGFTYLREDKLKDAAKAFDKAEALHVDAKRLPSLLAARAEVEWRLHDLPGARKDVDHAVGLELEDDPDTLELAGGIRMAQGDLADAKAALERSIRAKADNPRAHVLLARLFTVQEDVAQSRAHLALARRDQTLAELIEQTESFNRSLERRALWWKVPLFSVLVLALGTLLLFLAGGALSKIEMRSLTELRSSGATLVGEATFGEKIVHGLYSAVLWFGTIFFYLSVPAMVVVSLATGLGLLYLMVTQLDRFPIKLALLLILIAAGGTWAVIRSLFIKFGDAEGPLRVDEGDQPELFAALREVSEATGTAMVHRVYFEIGAGVSVREAGKALRVLLGKGERVLHLGFWALYGLTRSELKAILAHEYGHFSHGETRLTPVIARIENTMVQMLQRMAALGRAVYANPVWWYLRFYLQAFLATTASHSRRKELLADRAAALAYGGDAFGRALRSVVGAGLAFERYAGPVAALLRRSGRPCSALYQAVAAAQSVEPGALKDERLQAALELESDKYDSHPPSAERIARVAGVAGKHPADGAPALSLLRDPDGIGQQLAARVRINIDSQLTAQGVDRKPDIDLAPQAQIWFAEGLALEAAAINLSERNDPESNGFLQRAVDRLRAALGDGDPMLVPTLSRLAQAYEKGGHAADARAVVERGLAILAEHPDAEAQNEMQAALNRLGAA